jgi:hypothetical protein
MKSHLHYITNATAVDQFCAVPLAHLSYSPDSNRPDDRGILYVAPIAKASWDAPVGILLLYATTNGDPIELGQIEDGELAWTADASTMNGMRAVLARADWIHPRNGEGYSYMLTDAVADLEAPEDLGNFLDGVAESLGCDRSAADAQWAGYSRQLSDSARAKIEAGGRERGMEIGREIAAL